MSQQIPLPVRAGGLGRPGPSTSHNHDNNDNNDDDENYDTRARPALHFCHTTSQAQFFLQNQYYFSDNFIYVSLQAYSRIIYYMTKHEEVL